MRGEIASPNGYPLAYEMLDGTSPGVMFFSGFKSDMSGQKAEALAAHCKARDIAFTRFDYGGHGASGGAFEEGTIGSWLIDSLQVFDTMTEGKIILAGSSMGGWMALLLARLRPERVAGIIGIAAAPDFTERLIWNVATVEQKEQLLRDGYFLIPNCYGGEPYAITRALIDEGRNHLLITPTVYGSRSDTPPVYGSLGTTPPVYGGGKGGADATSQNIPPLTSPPQAVGIGISCPVKLLHGTKDEDVPLDIAHRLLEQLPNAKLTIVQDGDHRLSEPEHLQLLTDTLDQLNSIVTRKE